jgi:hypothetical protein
VFCGLENIICHFKRWSLTVIINLFQEAWLLFWMLICLIDFLKTTFWKVYLFLPLGVSRNPPPLTDIVSETLCLNKSKTLDNVQNWHVYWNTLLSRTFRLRINFCQILLGNFDLLYSHYILLACGTRHIYAEQVN